MDNVAELYPDERADSGPPKPYGDVTYADPKNGKYPIDTADHARAALSYFSMPKNHAGYSPEEITAIMGRIHAACKKFGIEVADQNRAAAPRPHVLYRAATVDDVKIIDRIITTIAIPYEEATIVRGGTGIGSVGFGRFDERWEEVVSRGAFNGIETAPHRIRANRDHDPTKPVGKAIKFYPEHPTGLVSEIKIAKTDLGDDTLQLADEGVLSASAAFGLRANGRDVDRLTRRCRINAAYLNHVAFVMNPAYVGAEVLSVRADAATEQLGHSLSTPTPELDQFIGDPVFNWAYDRLRRP